MPICERNNRPRFQIALKGDRATLVGELNDDVDGPRTVPGSVRIVARVVRTSRFDTFADRPV